MPCQFILAPPPGASASCFGRDAHFKPGKAPVVVLPVRGDATQVTTIDTHLVLHTAPVSTAVDCAGAGVLGPGCGETPVCGQVSAG